MEILWSIWGGMMATGDVGSSSGSEKYQTLVWVDCLGGSLSDQLLRNPWVWMYEMSWEIGGQILGYDNVASFIESIIKVARVPYSDSPRFPRVHIYCRTRIICSLKELDVSAPGWLTVCSLLSRLWDFLLFLHLCAICFRIALFVCFCQSTCLLHPFCRLRLYFS